MALTPEDVVNKRFQPTKFREGYDQDEVDDFLDEVVVELRRLNQENEELRQRVIAGESRISELQRTAGSGAVASDAASVGAPVAPAPAPAAAPVAEPAAAEPAAPAYSAESEQNNTNNLLQLARRLHEEHVREGIEKRDALIAEGRSTAAKIVSEAETEQREQLSSLEEQRTVLEQRIDDLRSFEREYRAKLKGHIEGLLHDLDASATPSGSAPKTGPVSGFAQKAEPKSTEGVNFDSMPAEPMPAEPVTADSMPAEPMSAEPMSADSATSDGMPAAPAPSTGFQGFGGH